MRDEAGDDLGPQIERAYLIATTRSPDSEELRVVLDGLRKLAERWRRDVGGKTPGEDETDQRVLENFCHALMNSAAFLYID